MFFAALLAIALVIAVTYAVRAHHVRPIENARIAAELEKDRFKSRYDMHNQADDHDIVAAVAGVITLALAITCFICTGINYGSHLEARKMALLLPQKEHQREVLIETVKAQLSNDEYAELTGIIDANTFVIFAKGTAVGDFLLARSAQIVGLNSEIYTLHNELDAKRIDLCNRLDNPFIPRLPFVGPDCAIDTRTPKP